jgi:integrase/recombinase XerD
MLTIYRRHQRDCKHRPKGRRYRDCSCPIWVQGTLAGESIRQSLDLRGWQKAQEKIREWEAAGHRNLEQRQSDQVTIEEARIKFLGDIEARKLNEATVYKYRLLFRQIEVFAAKHGIRFLSELDVDTLGTFRTEWKDGPRSSLKKLERLRAFFHFAQRRKWVSDNPALDLKSPKVFLRPTMPFTREEMIRTLAALDLYAESAGLRNAQRLRAFLLLLRYSGMRIGDAVQCSVDRITKNRLFLYTQKTGTPVYCVLPDFVIKALEASPRSCERFYFWTGVSRLHSAIGKWQRRLQRIFELAKVPNGHAHRFRDTFAVELLLAGVPLERVSVLLGHQSIRVTERHYAPSTRSRQEQLESDLQKAWSEDPVALLEGKGTPEVHEKGGRIN